MAVSDSRRHAGLDPASMLAIIHVRRMPGQAWHDGVAIALSLRPAHALGQFRDQRRHRLDGARRRLAVLVEAVLDRVDQRRADHHAVGAFGDGARLLRGAHAEADRDRQLGVALDARHRGVDLVRVGRGRAGDAGDRDVIDKARGVGEHRRQPLVVGGRRREPDEVQAGLQRRQAKLLVLLGRQIDDDQAVDAGGLCIGEKLRRRRRCRSDCSSPSARSASRRRPCGRRAPCASVLIMFWPALSARRPAGLDRRTVRHRIGERHAELDHVGAGLRQRLEDRERGLRVGIARHREGDERGAAFALQVREALIDAGGHLRERALGSTSGKVPWLRSRISAMRMLMVPSMISTIMPTTVRTIPCG